MGAVGDMWGYVRDVEGYLGISYEVQNYAPLGGRGS